MLDEVVILERWHAIVRWEETEVPRSAFELSPRAQRDEHLREARDHYWTVLDANPTHAPTWERMAHIHIDQGHLEGAYECLVFALRGDPERGGVHRAFAAVYLAHLRFAESAYHLDRARQLGIPPEDLIPLWREWFVLAARERSDGPAAPRTREAGPEGG